MLSLADRVSVIVFAFDSGDDRRELIRTLARDVEAAEKRLALLEAFLESRGLPKGWEGPLDAQKYLDIGVKDAGPVLPGCHLLPMRHWESIVLGTYIANVPRTGWSIPWGCATPEQRAEAEHFRE